ncbi:MAG: NUDIX hydrolase [Pleurocapsa sp.]
MISFTKDNQRFNFRVAGIAIADNYVLLHRLDKDDFWTFPGGRVELGETSQEALVRELKEELNTDIEIIRLLWLVENFFEYNSQQYHEIAFYYLMEFSAQSHYLDKNKSFTGVENDICLEFKWFPIDSEILQQLPLLPSFLQHSINNLPASVEHIVQYS